MVCSNEPGYYKQGSYGIRIENLVLVTEPVTPDGGDRPVMAFETLTMVPIDRRLIERSMLTEQERRWIDSYHAEVQAKIGPLVDVETHIWLTNATDQL